VSACVLEQISCVGATHSFRSIRSNVALNDSCSLVPLACAPPSTAAMTARGCETDAPFLSCVLRRR